MQFRTDCRDKQSREVAQASRSWGMVQTVIPLLVFLVPAACKAREATMSCCCCQKGVAVKAGITAENGCQLLRKP